MFIIGVLIGGAFVAHAAQGYRVNVGQTVYIAEFGKYAKNNCGQDVFVPTNTLLEQSKFIANKPTCVLLFNQGDYSYSAWSACSLSCGGGTQTRTQTCNYDSCVNPQATSQSCNTQSCGGTWTLTSFTGNMTTCCLAWVTSCNVSPAWTPPTGACSPIGKTCRTMLLGWPPGGGGGALIWNYSCNSSG